MPEQSPPAPAAEAAPAPEPGPASGRRTIPAVLARAIASFPEREAVVDGATRLTFADLGRRVRRCAGAMIASGVRNGDRVAIWAPNGHRFVVAALGAVTAGAVLVPINTRYKGAEAHWILAKSGARVLLVDNGFLSHDYLGMLCDPAAPELPALAEVVDLAAEPEPSASAWADFLARADRVTPDEVLARAAAVAEDDLSDMFFTSGTTGRPKGAMTTHGQNIRVYEAWIAGVGLRAGDRYLLVNPMFHTFGYKAGLLACLIRGATLIPQPVFDVAESLRLISQERVGVVPGPPTLYASILDHPARQGLELGSLRLAITGAAVVPVALVERMRAELFPSVVIAYGLTETCGTAAVGEPDADAQTIARTVGRPIEGTEIMVAGVDGAPVPTGESGEVLVRGYNVMCGYFDDPDATAAAIDPGGWLHTGDIGTLDERGNLRITDRLKDMFVVGGFNAYPAEIEQTITRHERVSEAAVIGVPDERLGEVGRAYVIPRPGPPVTETEIIEYCRARLANFKVPRSVRVVPALPRNASGKVLKFVLRDEAATDL
jgi:acyl-CoA synthetase (AMP-forming)/AMP-acid ligase II